MKRGLFEKRRLRLVHWVSTCKDSPNLQNQRTLSDVSEAIDLFLLVYLSEPLFCNGLLKIQVRDSAKIPETMVSQ